MIDPDLFDRYSAIVDADPMLRAYVADTVEALAAGSRADVEVIRVLDDARDPGDEDPAAPPAWRLHVFASITYAPIAQVTMSKHVEI